MKVRLGENHCSEATNEGLISKMYKYLIQFYSKETKQNQKYAKAQIKNGEKI